MRPVESTRSRPLPFAAAFIMMMAAVHASDGLAAKPAAPPREAPEADTADAAGEAPPAPIAPVRPGYTGAGSCSGVACHGSLNDKKGNILQTEYKTWLLSADRHFQAHKVLSAERSKTIWKNLHPDYAKDPARSDPSKAEECLVCHALPTKGWAQRLPDLHDGVSCESCHGPAGSWLGDHYKREEWRGGGKRRAIDKGDYWDMANLTVRAETCVSCHVGDPKRSVDHDLIAAGHPRLKFEMAAMDDIVRHWKPGRERSMRAVREWGVGQATALRELVGAAVRHTGARSQPDYTDLDCFSCHHRIADETPVDSWNASWRQRRYEGLGLPGRPMLNPAYQATLSHVASKVSQARWDGIAKDLGDLMAMLKDPKPDAPALSTLGERIKESLSALAREIDQASGQLDTAEMMLALSRELAADSSLEQYGFMGAEQVAYALDRLTRVMTEPGQGRAMGNAAEVRRIVKELSAIAQSPAAYDTARATFSEKLRDLQQSLQ